MQNIYGRLLRRKFFNRLLLTYTLIILATIFIISSTILQNLRRSAEQDAANSVKQAVQSVHGEFAQKVNTVKLQIQNLYINPKQNEDMMELLADPSPKLEDEKLSKAMLVNYFLDASAATDDDIFDALLYKKATGQLFLRSKDLTLNLDDYNVHNDAMFRSLDDAFYGLSITPAYSQTYHFSTKRNIFSIVSNIRGDVKSDRFKKSVAVFALNFNADRIANRLQSWLVQYHNAEISMLTKEGYVIIDSTGASYGHKFPGFEQIAQSQVGASDRSRIVEAVVDDYLGYYVVGSLPLSQVAGSFERQRNTVLFVASACALAALLLGFISIRLFSRRIRIINHAISKIQNGDLTYRIRTAGTNDEISMIAANLNEMSARLTDYIDRVYLSELKLKDAELHALQLQMDPHFLYNTLEVIRLEASASGSDHVGYMIGTLARLFRSSIKGGMVVSVQEELAFCENYLELYSIRYAGALTIDFQIDPNILAYSMPRHLLQPIMENTLRHGVDYSKPDNLVTVSGYKSEEAVVIEIDDNGCGIDTDKLFEIRSKLNRTRLPSGDSIGIANVHQRIRLLFGDLYGVEIDSERNTGTKVRIRFPAITRKEMMELVQSFAG